MIPSGRAVALLGALSVLSVFGFVEPAIGWTALALDAVVLVSVGFDGFRATRTAVEASRELPATAHQCEPLHGAIVLRNAGAAAVDIRVRDALHPALSAEPFRAAVVVPARTAVRVPLEFVPPLRGDAILPPLAIRVLGPWRLAWHGRNPSGGRRVRVLPRAHLEGESALVLRRALDWRAGAVPVSARGLSTELHALREYRPGDPVRMLHWKASARRNRPVMRETCWEQHQHVVVMVDCGRPMASMAGGIAKLDHALAAVLAVLRVVVAQGDAASLVLFSGEVRRVVSADRRTARFADLFEQVHDVQADLDEPDYAAAVAWCARKVPRRSLVLVCTSLLDALGAERLGRSLVGLAGRHRPLLVNLEDPGLLAVSRSIPDDVDGALSKVAALSMVSRLDALARTLQARGVDVVSCAADRLAVGMIDRYLAFKER